LCVLFGLTKHICAMKLIGLKKLEYNTELGKKIN